MVLWTIYSVLFMSEPVDMGVSYTWKRGPAKFALQLYWTSLKWRRTPKSDRKTLIAYTEYFRRARNKQKCDIMHAAIMVVVAEKMLKMLFLPFKGKPLKPSRSYSFKTQLFLFCLLLIAENGKEILLKVQILSIQWIHFNWTTSFFVCVIKKQEILLICVQTNNGNKSGTLIMG